MRWRRSTQHALVPMAAAPVPSTETLRTAALRASWRRDRAVGRRRVAWRWTLWYAQRWGPHALGVSLVFLLATQWWWPWMPTLRAPEASLAHGPTLPASPLPPPSTAPEATSDGTSAALPPDPWPVHLSLTGVLPPQPAGGTGNAQPPTVPATPHSMPAEALVPAPSLKFETWLNSKEI